MDLPFLLKYGEEKTLEVLEEAITDPDYRYSYTRGIVDEREGKVAGIVYGYTDEEEPIIDQPLEKKSYKKHGIYEQVKMFTDRETFPDEWYLDSICVSEEFRGQGIGSSFVRSIATNRQKQNRDVIGLSCDKQNPQARKLYERHGFKVIGERTISGHLYDHMQKKIV